MAETEPQTTLSQRLPRADSPRSPDRTVSWTGSFYHFLLVLLIILLPVQFATSFEIRLVPADFVLVLVVLVGGVRFVTSKDDWSIWHLILVVLFSASILNASLVFGVLSRWAVVNKYVGLLVLMLLYLVVVQYARSLPAVWRIARLVLISVTLQATVALPLYFVGLAYEPLHVYRIAALAADPNAYGGLIVLALSLHWATVNTSRRLMPRRLAWPVTLILLGNLLFCFSRSAWIGFAFVVAAILVLRRRAWPHIVLPLLAGVIVVLIFFRSYFAQEIWPYIARPAQIEGRFTILEDAVSSFVSHPVFGIGLGTYLATYGVQVHNTFFWLLAEMGMIGATAFLCFVAVFILRGFRAFRAADEEYRGLAAGLLIAHVAMVGLSLGIEAFYQRSWWVVMALLNACFVQLVRAPSGDPAPSPAGTEP